MPTYVYECRTCQKSFEVEQRITEAPLTDCDCGGTIRRIIQPVGIAFKGSGFYVNDSTSKTSASKPSEAAPAETKPSDSKPATEGHAATPAPPPPSPSPSE